MYKMNKTKLLIFAMFLFCIGQSYAQKYEVQITPVEISALGGLQSYAVGSHDGEWLLVGGRLDGLHRRQPFASFSEDGKNQDLIVVNPTTKEVWRSPLSELSSSIREQLSSTNMQFYQDGNHLICTGGYGYSPTANDHITYPYLTRIDLPSVISKIKNDQNPEDEITQIENEAFRVTGGALNKIDDVFYLVGGHKFMGRYNPMGPTHGPGFEQEYTNEIRKFTVATDNQISVNIINAVHDEMNLHRRDYNLVPYLSDGQRELMIYSGVFQQNADLPYLYPVSIQADGYTAIESFSQYYNHYHCAYLPIFDGATNEMNTLFFGGIAQFYQEDGWLVQDNDVPFVNTIAEINQSQDQSMIESVMSDTMPGLLGAGSVLILNDDITLADYDIVDASSIGEDYVSVGHIYGGIRSSLPNIFWINTGVESIASNTVYEVSIRRRSPVSTSFSSDKEENLQFYPNPAQNLVRMSLTLSEATDINVTITDPMGKLISTKIIPSSNTKSGRNIIVLDNITIGYGAFYYRVEVAGKVLTRKVIWSE